MKRIIFIVILLAVMAAIFFILRSNKNKLDMNQELSERDIQVIPVRVDTAKLNSLGFTLSYAAILEPADKLIVMSQTEGEVIHVNNSLGDRVRKDQVIVKVDDELLKANTEVARASYEKAVKDLERFEKMITQDGVTEDQLEKMRLNEKNAKATLINLEKRIELTSIEAPFTGFINQMFTKKGALLGKGVPVFEIVDIDQFKILLNLSEKEILRIKEDMRITIIPKSIDTLRLRGEIRAIAKSSNMAQQYPLEIHAENPFPEILRGGLLVTVQIQSPDESQVLTVSRESVRESEGEYYLYKISGEKAQKITVQTGRQNEDLIEIRQGLNAGDLIISSGIEAVTDGQKIRIIEESTGT